MKLGIISDVHSNLRALKVMLNKFDEIGVDKIIFLGDIVGVGYNPEETINLLKEYENKLIGVTGNHEEYLLNGLPEIVHGNRKMGEEEIANHKWNHEKISYSSREFLKAFDKEKIIEINNTKIYIVHFPIDEEKNYYLTSIDYKDVLKKVDADIYLFGHTHKLLKDFNGKYYINPGSLGCPKNVNKALAGILSIEEKITYQEIELEYDINATINEILSSNMPMKEDIIKIFYRG